MGFPTTIREIYIGTQTDDGGRQSADIEIRIGDSLEGKGKFNEKCGDKHTIKPGEFSTITCNNTGRYIYISSPGDNKQLSLCEVVPYGMGKNKFLIN